MSATLKAPVNMTVAEFLEWCPDDGQRWQLVDGEPVAMAPGATGPGIDWLRARLDHSGPAVFDAALEATLRQYQRSQGLVPDGIPGPATRTALAAADTGPQLQRTTE